MARKRTGRSGSRGRERQKAKPTLQIYAPERRAEFLLSNAVDEDDYARAVEEVRKMGLEPARIPHYKPCE